MLKHLLTKQGENLGDLPLGEYPRPAFKRDSYFCLNGQWDFACNKNGEIPKSFNEKILVPYCPESLLSGINRVFHKGDFFVYKRTFALPNGFKKDKIFLNFGAVNRAAKVYLNGAFVGEHIGSYLPFSFDVTEHLKEENEIAIVCENNFDDFIYPYGKQCRKRGGMWYTPCSGIWQTVWLESVPKDYIESIDISTENDLVNFSLAGAQNGVITILTPNGSLEIPFSRGKARLTLKNPVFWSPENPYLYYCTVKSEQDEVKTYFALRTLEIKEIGGIMRTCLNGKPYFFNGLLDQGYFSDGIYTPASYENFEEDILTLKKLGFNMLRKHIKIEPQYFYYLCDKLGIVVFQDMVNNGKYSFFRDTALPTIGLKYFTDTLLHTNKKSRKVFENYMADTVTLLKKHPSICCWTIFNEGWGQFCANDMYLKLKAIDSTRFIDSASGWFKANNNDFDSLHIYFKPVKTKKTDKPVFLSEFGGYSFKITEHSFNDEQTYGYKKIESLEDFQRDFTVLYKEQVIPAIKNGLCATVYTQVSDVEDETNGLLTYDRKILKVDAATVKGLNDDLFKEFYSSF
ncbi:MAG: glycoside hydrolase family 2 [Ruminococcaceae bacterium]|nr:glycoside hydrolase family 2 [Oscillospiraceae bacterium]